jgi:hypothetical protein
MPQKPEKGRLRNRATRREKASISVRRRLLRNGPPNILHATEFSFNGKTIEPAATASPPMAGLLAPLAPAFTGA